MPGRPAGKPVEQPTEGPLADAAYNRHVALMRMLGHLKDALAPKFGARELYRAAALAGYNANPDPAVANAEPGMKALWAEADAEAVLAVGSDEVA
jgi:hypothetical protein